MSDYASSLPVRTENDGDVVVKIGDRTIPSQQLVVMADGSINVNDNGGSITVDAVNLDIRDLVFATDKVDVSGSTVALDAPTLAALESITVQNGAGAAAVNIQDGGNSITVDGTVELGATTLAALETITANQGTPNTVANSWNVSLTDGTDTVLVTASGELSVLATAQPGVDIGDVTINNAAGAAAVNIQDGGNSITVDAVNLDIRDLTHVSDSVSIGDGTDLLGINTDGSINVVVLDNTPGTAINDYNTVAAVAAAATSNHDYTVTAGKTLYLNQIESSGSGKMKIEVQIETAAASGIFNTKWVKFNSTADTNMSIHIDNNIVVAAGVRVRVIRTNRDNQAQDVYSTISGYELP